MSGLAYLDMMVKNTQYIRTGEKTVQRMVGHEMNLVMAEFLWLVSVLGGVYL